MFKDTKDISKALDSKDSKKVADLLDGSDYNQGMLEDLEGHCRRQAMFISKLTLLLIRMDAITFEDAVELFEGLP